jgi:Fes/CIP4, and EFC/F-BAR homology domain
MPKDFVSLCEFEHGFEHVKSSVENGASVMKFMGTFWKRFADIEKSYAKSIASLCQSATASFSADSMLSKLSSGSSQSHMEDVRSLQAAWQVLKHELMRIAKHHAAMSSRVVSQVVEPLTSFVDERHHESMCENGRKMAQALDLRAAVVRKAQQRYYRCAKTMDECNAAYERERNLAETSVERATKLLHALSAAKQSHASAHAEYRRHVDECRQMHNSVYGKRLPALLLDLQRLEETRINIVQLSLANFVSIVGSVPDVAAECCNALTATVAAIDKKKAVRELVDRYHDRRRRRAAADKSSSATDEPRLAPEPPQFLSYEDYLHRKTTGGTPPPPRRRQPPVQRRAADHYRKQVEQQQHKKKMNMKQKEQQDDEEQEQNDPKEKETIDAKIKRDDEEKIKRDEEEKIKRDEEEKIEREKQEKEEREKKKRIKEEEEETRLQEEKEKLIKDEEGYESDDENGDASISDAVFASDASSATSSPALAPMPMFGDGDDVDDDGYEQDVSASDTGAASTSVLSVPSGSDLFARDDDDDDDDGYDSDREDSDNGKPKKAAVGEPEEPVLVIKEVLEEVTAGAADEAIDDSLFEQTPSAKSSSFLDMLTEISGGQTSVAAEADDNDDNNDDSIFGMFGSSSPGAANDDAGGDFLSRAGGASGDRSADNDDFDLFGADMFDRSRPSEPAAQSASSTVINIFGDERASTLPPPQVVAAASSPPPSTTDSKKDAPPTIDVFADDDDLFQRPAVAEPDPFSSDTWPAPSSSSAAAAVPASAAFDDLDIFSSTKRQIQQQEQRQRDEAEEREREQQRQAAAMSSAAPLNADERARLADELLAMAARNDLYARYGVNAADSINVILRRRKELTARFDAQNFSDDPVALYEANLESKKLEEIFQTFRDLKSRFLYDKVCAYRARYAALCGADIGVDDARVALDNLETLRGQLAKSKVPESLHNELKSVIDVVTRLHK